MAKEDLAVDQEEQAEDQEFTGEEETPEAKAFARLKESISVTREDLGGLRVKLTVTVPRKTMEERLHEQFAELKREAMVPGFRKGHAPLKLIEKRFGGEVGEELKSKLIGSGCLAAVERENLKTLGDPFLWVKTKETPGDRGGSNPVEVEKLLPFDKALDHLSLPKEGPLTFACEVELKPEFELPKLTQIPIQKPKVRIGEEDVDAEITRLLSWRGTFEPVVDGPVKADDLLYVDMKATVDGNVIASEENIELPARDVAVKGVPLRGLGKALTGKKVGDGVTITAQVPEDHDIISARGKQAKFEFTIREIKRWTAPPLDAELISALGYDSEEELRNRIRASLEARLQRIIKEKMFEQIGDYLVDSTPFEVPAGLSQRQADRAIARRTIDLLQRGLPPAEVSKIVDGLRSKAKEQVTRDLKLFFILEKIGDERGIEVNEEELNAAIAEIAAASGKRFDRVRDELSKQDGLTGLYLRIRDEKVFESLLADAEITEVEGPEKKPSMRGASKKKSEKVGEEEEKPAKRKAAKRPTRSTEKKAPAPSKDTAPSARQKKNKTT